MAVVNRTLAERYFGTDDPIGRRIELRLLATLPTFPVEDPSFEIVGGGRRQEPGSAGHSDAGGVHPLHRDRRVLRSQLFGVTPNDPVTLAAVAALVMAAACLPCYLPACRATRVDPMVPLRYE